VSKLSTLFCTSGEKNKEYKHRAMFSYYVGDHMQKFGHF